MISTRFMTLTAALVVSAAAFTACGDDDDDVSGPEPGVEFGPSLAFGDGLARSFVKLDDAGVPNEIGLRITEDALVGLPETPPANDPAALMITLQLPAEAAAIGFDHVDLAWNPQGHEPPGVYDLPHFDVHFYTISPAEKNAILPDDPQFAEKAANLPAAGVTPPTYVPPPGDPAALAVPRMGLHWTSTEAPEANGETFTNTLLFGSWDGRFIFMEPMITKAYLETHPTATISVPQPAGWVATTHYPTSYTLTFDESAREFRIALAGLTPVD
jgi:hypothetical protein